MKRKILVSMIILALALMALGPSVGLAAYAYQVQFTTYITYQNIGTATTQTLDINLYESQSDTTPLVVPQPNLAVDASTSVSVGTLGAPEGFQGTAVLSADQPLAATAVQLPPGVAIEPNARNRPMSNGFAAGTQNVLIASVQKNAGSKEQYTKFGVQNAGDTSVSITIEFYGTSATPVYILGPQTLQPGAGYQVDAGTISQLGSSFTGSAVIKTTSGSIVGGAMELDNHDYGSKAFEGVGQGATTIYMPSALCNYNATGVIQNTNYAIQNNDPDTNANITVTWSNGNFITKSNIPPYNKAVFNGCEGGNPAGFIGAATVTSNTDIIGLGKVAGGGLSTAFIGFASGSEKIALPYIRWAADTRWFAGTMQRAVIAIQNVGAPFTGNITVKYINPNGTQAGSTHTIPVTNMATGDKVNSNPTFAGLSEFGCQNNCSTFGGGAIVQGPSGTHLVALARLTSYVPATGQRVGEDTSGVVHP